jgi:hypothetical protein
MYIGLEEAVNHADQPSGLEGRNQSLIERSVSYLFGQVLQNHPDQPTPVVKGRQISSIEY